MPERREMVRASNAALARVVPPGHLTMVLRQFDYWLTVYRRTWKGTVISSFVLPLLYVAAMGILLGGFINKGTANLEGAPSYLAYIAPGLAVAQAMQTATGEVTYPVMGAIKWHRTYYAQIATPLRVSDVVAANFVFVVFRVATSCGVFLVVLGFFGVYASLLGAVAAFGVTVLVGLAFTTPLYACAATMTNDAGFSIIFRLVVLPMFLFSGAFFPISNLSPALEWLARLTPLWHGVDLARMLTLGHLHAGLVTVHLGYLATLVVLGWWLSVRALGKRLVN